MKENDGDSVGICLAGIRETRKTPLRWPTSRPRIESQNAWIQKKIV